MLVVLAIPPILSGTYAGVESVDPAARDAASGMGMTGPEVLLQVEVPCALPLVFSGLRSAALQIVATATIAAIVGLGGLGRFLIDGQTSRDFPQMACGRRARRRPGPPRGLRSSPLVQRYAVSPGLTGRARRRATMRHSEVAVSAAAGETRPSGPVDRPEEHAVKTRRSQ